VRVREEIEVSSLGVYCERDESINSNVPHESEVAAAGIQFINVWRGEGGEGESDIEDVEELHL
jgi:hypothetical protein